MAGRKKQSTEAVVREIRRRIRREFAPEEKIRIVLDERCVGTAWGRNWGETAPLNTCFLVFWGARRAGSSPVRPAISPLRNPYAKKHCFPVAYGVAVVFGTAALGALPEARAADGEVHPPGQRLGGFAVLVGRRHTAPPHLVTSPPSAAPLPSSPGTAPACLRRRPGCRPCPL